MRASPKMFRSHLAERRKGGTVRARCRVLGGLVGLFFTLWTVAVPRLSGAGEGAKGTIRISGAWALYPMVVKWGEVYMKANPGIRVDISAGGAGKGAADALSGLVDIGMVSREIQPAEIQKGGFCVAVVKDAVLPVVNEKNPVIKDLLTKGVKRETFVGVWIKHDLKSWGEVAGTEAGDAVHVYTRSDACGAAETWAKYLGGKQEDLKGVGVFGDPGIAERVRRDPLGIGYNNLNFAYSVRTRKANPGLAIVPIDVNGNGKLDKEEQFYENKDTVLGAIADGRYPSPPARDLNFLTKGKPSGAVAEFIRWALTEGQKYADEAGYVPLPEARRQEELAKLR